MSFTYPTGIPHMGSNLFMSSSSHFPTDFSNPIFNTNGSANHNMFTSDDRMLLWTLYHQQQIIQFQLNLLLPSMHQMKKVLDEIERLLRPQRLHGLHESKEEKSTESPTSPPVATKMKQSTEPMTVVERSTDADATQTKMSGTRAVATTVVEESRSCTPPVEVSGPQSASNRSANVNNSVDSVAAPWDPSTGVPLRRTSSISSTVKSQLNRSNNPLLSTRHSRTAPMTELGVSGSSHASRLHSLHCTHIELISAGKGLTGDTMDQTSAHLSSSGLYVPPTIAPRRVTSVPTSLDREIPPYRNVASAPRASQKNSEKAPGKLKRRNASINRVSIDNKEAKECAPEGTISSSFAPVTQSLKPFFAQPLSLSGAEPSRSQRTHAFGLETKDPRPDFNSKDDSLSEGYGSYESQEYLRGIGFLQ